MKYLLSVFFIVTSLCVDAQKVNPNEIRVKIYDTILKDADRDFWMTAEEAKNYGMIDSVLVK